MQEVEKIKEFVTARGLIAENDKIVAGISGGADSVCLLLVLKEIVGAENIFAVHVNHGIRGEEAERDENFVKRLCERHGVCFTVKRTDVPAFAKENGMSEEEAGRVIRYNAFEEVRILKNADRIAVAHNSEDNAETFLINLARGSGITGLTGIKAENGKIIRPLLYTDRQTIEGIVGNFSEDFVSDSTNASLIYTRNKIRNEIVPRLKEVNARAVEHINQAAYRLERAEDYILGESGKAYARYVSEGKDVLIRHSIAVEHDVIADEVLYRALTAAAGRAKDIGYVHISDMKRLLESQVGRRIDLPYGIKALRVYEGIRLTAEGNEKFCKPKLPEMRISVEKPGKIEAVRADENNIEIRFADGSTRNLVQSSCIRWFDYGRIAKGIAIRTRNSGDYIIISDDGKKKKLKSYFIDSKIPSEVRETVPVVASGSEVLWVVGYRTGEGAKITRNTEEILRVELDF